VPLGDVEGLTRAMTTLIQNPGLREHMGRAGRDRARLFTARVAVPRFEQIYRQLVLDHNGRTHENHALSLG
jgi:glycosyltransferase involved in cell wall biosynthesis